MRYYIPIIIVVAVLVGIALLFLFPGAAPACTNGATRTCDVDGCAGAQTCTGGHWGNCVKTDPSCGVAGCTEGETAACTINGCAGTKTCVGGQWGDCASDPSCGIAVHTENILISDMYNDRVLEVDAAKNIVWQYENSNVLIDPNSAQRLANGNTLITGAFNVIEADASGNVVWQYDLQDYEQIRPGAVFYPERATRLQNGNTLISSVDSHEVIEVTLDKHLVWSFSQLSTPRHAVRLGNGNTLIADDGGYRVIEVDSAGNIVWEYESTCVGMVLGPSYAVRLADGNTLITECGNAYEVDAGKNIVWNTEGLELWPRAAIRLANGNTLIADTGNDRVVEITPDKQIIWELSGLSGPNEARPV